MGKGEHGHFAGTHGGAPHHNLTDNLPALTKRFPLSIGGYFGVKGSGKTSVRRIESNAPVTTAKEFFRLATNRGESMKVKPNGAIVMKMKDGTQISYRETSSSDGSPAVDINIASPVRVKRQKIHFVNATE